MFYNKEQAAQIGMTEPPATLAEFEALLAAAKEAGLQPIMQWNAAASGGGLAFPLQNLMASLGPVTPINEWIYQKEGATIDTPTNLEAAQHLQQWIEAGYFPEDVNAIEYTDSNSRFAGGEGVFTFNGDWQNAQYDTDAPGNIGFFLLPPAEEGAGHAAMSSPLTFGIAANAKNADCAAFFLNWVATDPTARQINVDIGGSSPGGPSDLALPTVKEGSITNETLAAAQVVAAENGAHGLHRERDRRHLPRPGRMDPGAPEPGRRPADARGRAPDRPGLVRGGPRPVIAPAGRWHEG